MVCPYLAYRSEGEDRTFDEDRAYCTAVDRFVQPMRADVCNDRYDLDHAAHCELYREAEGLPAVEADHGSADAADSPGEEP